MSYNTEMQENNAELEAILAEVNALPDASGGDSARVMTGATATSAGTSGLVPAPAAGDQDKVLYGDGTWKAPSGATGDCIPVPTTSMSESLAAILKKTVFAESLTDEELNAFEKAWGVALIDGDTSEDEDYVEVETGEIIYFWNFAQSLTDTVGGITADTNGTIDENGITFTESSKYIMLLSNGDISNKVVEIDIFSGMLIATGKQHARLFSVAPSVNTAATANAFTWRYNNDIGWTVYNGWGTSLDETVYPITFFDKKTIRLEFDSDGYVTLLCSDIGANKFKYICKFDKRFSRRNEMFVIGGSGNNDLYPITISGIRIYEGVV